MRIGIIGNGNMGKSVLNLLVRNGFQMNTVISDKKPVDPTYFSDSVADNIKKSDLIFLCVKPQEMHNILPHFQDTENKTIVSCAAAYPISEIKKYTQNNVVRVMCNLSIKYASYGTICYYSEDSTEDLFKIFRGPKIVKLENEKDLDVATVLAGSSPAFISLITQQFLDFGIQNNLSEKQSQDIFVSMVEGTVKMMRDHSLKEIIQQTSSKKGITETGIKYMQSSHIERDIMKTLNISLEKINSLKN